MSSAYISGEEIRDALIDAGVVTDDGYPSPAEEAALERLGNEVTALLRDRAKDQYPRGVPQSKFEFTDLDEDGVTLDFYKLARETLDAFDQGPWQLLSAQEKHQWSVALHELAEIAERDVNEELEAFEDEDARPDWDHLFDVGEYLGKPAMLEPEYVRRQARLEAVDRHRPPQAPTWKAPEPEAPPPARKKTKGKIAVGGTYLTKVSGSDVPVRVIQDVGHGVSRYRVERLNGRRLEKLRSARALKPLED